MPLATRVADGDLFYHLNDPTGASLALVDETGAAAGRMVYDGYGGVLSNTLPLTLSGTLADAPDAATGLVHQGGGRYYDPTLGRPLQPNPAGGPPAVPQALNRYAATPAGQPGVYQAASNDTVLNSLLGATESSALSTLGGMAISTYANRLSGELFIQANEQLLARAGYQNLFRRVLAPGRGRSAFYFTGLVRPAGNRTFHVLASGQTIDLKHLEAQVISKRWPVRYPQGQAFDALDDNLLKQVIRTTRGEIAASLGSDLLLAWPELAATWQNPYFNKEQQVVQSLITISGVGASAGASVWVGSLAASASLGGPITFILVTGTGIVVWAGWEYGLKPAVSWVFVASGSRDPFAEYRDLRPMGTGE